MAVTPRHAEWWIDLPMRIRCLIRGDWWRTRFGQWLCERGGHKPGVWWYNPYALEPNMHCRRCDKDLG